MEPVRSAPVWLVVVGGVVGGSAAGAGCLAQRPQAPVDDPADDARTATIVAESGRWTLENGALSAVVVADDAAGTVDLASFYNKLAGVEYLGGAAGSRRLFRHHVIAGDQTTDVD